MEGRWGRGQVGGAPRFILDPMSLLLQQIVGLLSLSCHCDKTPNRSKLGEGKVYLDSGFERVYSP